MEGGSTGTVTSTETCSAQSVTDLWPNSEYRSGEPEIYVILCAL